ncbi:MAG TPA: Uma2 family endonuclease, partial [Longimicrobiales bacterium]|nr:Uma2 family endonuclease [Longimicrobiales bacterium]
MEASLSPLTLEAYASLDDPDDLPHSELVGGLVVREPRPGGAHGLVQVNLAHALRSWTANRPEARVFVESGFVLARDPPTVRGPDVGV